MATVCVSKRKSSVLVQDFDYECYGNYVLNMFLFGMEKVKLMLVSVCLSIVDND